MYSNRLKEMENQSAMVEKFAQTGDRSGCKVSSLVQKEGTWSPERGLVKAFLVGWVVFSAFVFSHIVAGHGLF